MVCAEACMPNDIRTQIGLLEHYIRTTFDIIGNLEPDLSFKVLRYLTIPELLGVEPVGARATLEASPSNLLNRSQRNGRR